MDMEIPENLQSVWHDECRIEVIIEPFDSGHGVTISANQEGLISLARLLLYIASERVSEDCYIELEAPTILESTSNIGLSLRKNRLKGNR
jgi:hypothetical protein